MTRQEQIQHAANNYKMQFPDGYISESTYIAGAQWADENPKEGLIDINKAIEYLANYLLCTGYNLQTKSQFIHNFRIAMEK